MTRFVLMVTSLLVFTTPATGFGAPTRKAIFARFERLRSEFPEAFARYTHREFIVPTRKAWFTRANVDSWIHVPVHLTWLGRINEPNLEIAAWYHRPTASRLQLSNVQIPSVFPIEYAWRVLIAELLKDDSGIREIHLVLSAVDGGPSLGACAEKLATGVPRTEAVAASPMHQALTSFGFDLDRVELDAGKEWINSEDHWYGELDLRVRYRR